MKTVIKTNQLLCNVDTNKVDQKYEIFSVTTSDKFSYGAQILDEPLLENSIKAIVFVSGKKFFVLMERTEHNKKILKNVFEKTEYADRFALERIESRKVPTHTLFQLLMNSLATRNNPLLRFNNLTGHLYCFHPEWLKRKDDFIWQIPCVEICVLPECELDIKVRTFTSVLMRKKMKFEKTPFKKFPQYVFSVKNTLRRKLSADNEESAYILKQILGPNGSERRNTIPFIDFQDISRFNKTKMGIVVFVLEMFNETFKGVANLSFKEVVVENAIDFHKRTVKANEKLVREILIATGIKVVDSILNEDSKAYCLELVRILKENYGVKAKIGSRLSKSDLNIRVIHNDAYYEDKEVDPHDDVYGDYSIQHITIEDFPKGSPAAISAVAHELIIKNDLLRGRISLYDWNSIGFDGDVAFGIVTSELDEQDNRYFFMTIHPDGSFEMEEQVLDLFSMDRYSECVQIFDGNKDVHGVVRFGDGSINVLKETTLFTVPKIFNIKEELLSGNTYLRNKEKKDELFSSILDIKLFSNGTEQYYFVGAESEGMRSLIGTSSLIRKVEPYGSSKLRFDELLPLLNVTFVRNGQMTVIPFPYKYLREYVKLVQGQGK